MGSISNFGSWIVSNPSILERMNRAKGHPSGFDYMRVSLALLIIFNHCFNITGSAHVLPGVVAYSFVPMFFGLSGYLVAGSLDRTAWLGTFVGLRILRIVPALGVDTIFSALVLGPVFTTLAVNAYLSDPAFHAYFLNIVGDVHFVLPGVFQANPAKSVNAQLWTIPYELMSYVALVLLSIIGFYRRRAWFLAATLVASALFPLANHFHPDAFRSQPTVTCFLWGVVFQLYADRIPWNVALALAAAAVSIVLAGVAHLRFLYPLPIVYLTIFLGVLNPRKLWPLQTGDYSYGLYLYGFPLQQAVFTILPFARSWYGNLIVSIPVAMVFATLSWHLVEKHMLAQKKYLYALETSVLARWPKSRQQPVAGP